jgi:hypothetical protein
MSLLFNEPAIEYPKGSYTRESDFALVSAFFKRKITVLKTNAQTYCEIGL